MTTKTIPAQTIKVCDCCGATMDRKNSRQDGGLIIKADALDMYGHAVADATRKMDLCDSCLHRVTKAIDETIAAQGDTP